MLRYVVINRCLLTDLINLEINKELILLYLGKIKYICIKQKLIVLNYLVDNYLIVTVCIIILHIILTREYIRSFKMLPVLFLFFFVSTRIFYIFLF